jgi:putative inorganic carbon (HCO3(-)) transporter
VRARPGGVTLAQRYPSVQVLILLGACLVAALVGVGLGTQVGEAQMQFVYAAVGGAAGILILIRPLWGLGLFAAGVCVADILPSISFATSALVLLGAAALFGFLLEMMMDADITLTWHPAMLAGALFILWFTTTDTKDALSAVTNVAHGATRSWLLTYVQLLALVWLASQILSSPGRHRTLMWFFSVGAACSAVIALGQAAVQGTFNTSTRASGLLEVNSSARYYAVAFVLFVYLATVSRGLWRPVALGGAVLVLGGEAATLSRSGLALIVLGAGLLLWDRFRAGRRRQVVLIVGALLFGALLVPRGYFSVEFSSIQNSLNPNSKSTALLRLDLWRAGYHMWLDHPVQGVGIGQFNSNLVTYDPAALNYKDPNLGPHNLYVAVLSETGAVGFVLYMLMVLGCYRAVRRAWRTFDQESQAAARAWMISLLVLLAGGITKHDQYDKILWLIFGACLSFGTGYLRYVRRTRDPVERIAAGTAA